MKPFFYYESGTCCTFSWPWAKDLLRSRAALEFCCHFQMMPHHPDSVLWLISATRVLWYINGSVFFDQATLWQPFSWPRFSDDQAFPAHPRGEENTSYRKAAKPGSIGKIAVSHGKKRQPALGSFPASGSVLMTTWKPAFLGHSITESCLLSRDMAALQLHTEVRRHRTQYMASRSS